MPLHGPRKATRDKEGALFIADSIPSSRRFGARTNTIMVACVSAITSAGVFVLAYRLLEAQTAPSGLVEFLQLIGFNTSNPAFQVLTYKGYTNFPGSEGSVEIYVLREGNGGSTNSLDSRWRRVTTVRPSNEGTVVDGEIRYTGSTGVFRLFFPFPYLPLPSPPILRLDTSFFQQPDVSRQRRSLRLEHQRQQRQLYRQAVAKACRTCHISAQGNAGDSDLPSPRKAFGTFTAFEGLNGRSALLVCGNQKVMPQAEQTLKVFWESSARSHFLNRAGIRNTGCGYEVTYPPDSTATNTTLRETLRRHDSVSRGVNPGARRPDGKARPASALTPLFRASSRSP